MKGELMDKRRDDLSELLRFRLEKEKRTGDLLDGGSTH
jgi:hypothetical protein